MADDKTEDLQDLNDGEREELGFGTDALVAKGFGFSDPGGEYPRPKYHFKSSINLAATGESKHRLSMGGGNPSIKLEGFSFDLIDDIPSQYGDVQVEETKSGHVVVYDDTPSAERILIKHKNGSGFELRSDGSLLIKTEHNLIQSVGGSGSLIIDGDLKVSTKNLDWDVAGDFNMKVGGDWNTHISGDKIENVDGSSRSEIGGNDGTIVKGNQSNTVLKTYTKTILGDNNESVKGNSLNAINGSYSLGATGFAKMTSETEYAISAPNINIAGADVSVIGDYGTIGGENIIMYNYNMYTGHTVWSGDTVNVPTVHSDRVNATSMHATTFHGDLDGNATTSTQSSLATSLGGVGGTTTVETATNTPNDTTATHKPDSSIMSEYLNKSSRGIQKVFVDVADYLKNKIDLNKRTNGSTRRKLTTAEARCKLKNPANLSNAAFINDLFGRGVISDDIAKSVPPAIGRSSSADGSYAYMPEKFIKNGAGQGSNKLVAGQRVYKELFPSMKYDPTKIPNTGPKSINGKTLIGKGIPISTFLSGIGGSTTLNHIDNYDDRLAIARQLLLQTEVIETCKNHTGKFADFKCVVTEGIYKPDIDETVTAGSIKDLAQSGRAITYELFDQYNRSYPDITFEYAEYLSEFMSGFDKIILNYDQLNPNDNDITSQIIVIMPEVDENYSIKDKRPLKFEVETRFNNNILSNTDLIEVLKPV